MDNGDPGPVTSFCRGFGYRRGPIDAIYIDPLYRERVLTQDASGMRSRFSTADLADVPSAQGDPEVSVTLTLTRAAGA